MSQNKTQNLNKINQIILYSQNFAAHKKMVTQVKPRIDSLSTQRNIYRQKLTNQHTRYVNAVQRLKNQQLDKSNKKFSQKLIEISKSLSKQKAPKQKQKQATSRSFWNLKTAKQRQRTKDQKQIILENKKMTQRISKSRSKQNFGRQSYFKQKAQTMKDLNIRGEFSERSQSVLENLVYNDLKINRKDIPFLPLLSQRRKITSQNQEKGQKTRNSNEKYFKNNFQREHLSFQRQMNFKL